MRLGACAGRSNRSPNGGGHLHGRKGNRTSIIGTPPLKRLFRFVRHEDGPSARRGHARTCRPSCSSVNVTPTIGWLSRVPRNRPTTSPSRTASPGLFGRTRKRRRGRASSPSRLSPAGRLSEIVCAYELGGRHSSCALSPSLSVRVIGGREGASPSVRVSSWSCTRRTWRSSTNKCHRIRITDPNTKQHKMFFSRIQNRCEGRP